MKKLKADVITGAGSKARLFDPWRFMMMANKHKGKTDGKPRRLFLIIYRLTSFS